MKFQFHPYGFIEIFKIKSIKMVQVEIFWLCLHMENHHYKQHNEEWTERWFNCSEYFCSCRVPGFNSQYPHDVSQPFVTSVSGDSMCFFSLLSTKNKQNTSIHANEILQIKWDNTCIFKKIMNKYIVKSSFCIFCNLSFPSPIFTGHHCLFSVITSRLAQISWIVK